MLASSEEHETTGEPDAGATTARILDHHLGAFAGGLDEILKDYSETSVLITPERVYRGLVQIGQFFQLFLEGANEVFWKGFGIDVSHVEGEIAYLVWHSGTTTPRAVDTLLVREGKIITQTFTSNVG